MRSRLPFVGSRLSLHDPVAPRVVLLRIAFCAAVSTLLIVGGRAFAQRAGALIGFVLSTPLWGALLARPLLELGIRAFVAMRDDPLRRWQGAYYAFDGVHVRVFEDEGRLWIGARDVAAALGVRRGTDAFLATHPHGARAIDGLTCIDVATAESWALALGGRDAKRFAVWLRREVEAPWLRRRERGRLHAS